MIPLVRRIGFTIQHSKLPGTPSYGSSLIKAFHTEFIVKVDPAMIVQPHRRDRMFGCVFWVLYEG